MDATPYYQIYHNIHTLPFADIPGAFLRLEPKGISYPQKLAKIILAGFAQVLPYAAEYPTSDFTQVCLITGKTYEQAGSRRTEHGGMTRAQPSSPGKGDKKRR